jgi:capsular exopolysaccharide synthesis family protein
MPYSNNMSVEEAISGSQVTKIDYKRVLYRLLKYWYLVILSIVGGFTYGFLKNRYAVPIYTITASIIIHQKEESTGAELLYKNSIIDAYRNYLNDPYLLRSYPLIGSVIERLNFEIAFFQQGKIKKTEAYDLPIKVRLLKKNGSYGASLSFKALDNNSFLIRDASQTNEEGKVFNFNDSIEYGGHHLMVQKNVSKNISEILNVNFTITFLDPFSVTSSYVSRLGVGWAEEGSGVLNLSVIGSNVKKESDFLNGLISTYQQYDLDKKNQRSERTVHFIKKQLDEISDSLKIFERQLDQFKTSNSSEALGEEASRLFEKLDPLEQQRMELMIRSKYYDYLTKYISQKDNFDLIVLPSSVGITDGVLTGLVEKMLEIQTQLKSFIGKGRDENPLVQESFRKLAEIKNDMREAVNTLRATDKIKTDFLQSQIAEVDKQIKLLPLEQRQLISIKRNYDLLENLYVFLMQKMWEAGISKASTISDISVVNPPMVSGQISPNTGRIYLFGIGIGIALPILIFGLLEFFNNKIQSKEDIDKIASIPFIGGIGHSESKDNLVVANSPKSAVAESFRAIRANLNYFTGNQIKKVFMITSSVSGEGKTFSTINLATIFAMSGRKTLIVGADMRKPKIYNDFKLDNQRGLSGYLSKLNTFSEIIQHTSIENLDLISAGPVPPNPSELLLTSSFEELIKEALQIYDYIIVDTPPLAIVTDAFVLSKYVDHIVFIVRQNYTEKALLREIKDFYSSEKLKNISIVLNDINKTGYGYGYGHNYGYGYGLNKMKNGHGYYS